MLVAGAGYGKTMALEDAIQLANRRSVWVACGSTGREAGRVLLEAVEGLRGSMPGLADVMADRLAAGVEPVDVRSATGALLAELERLLVEPLVIVFDDAEEFESADACLALVDQLLNFRAAPLSVAVATRRPLPLKLAKLRAAGRLVEVGPADLSFTASECEELLKLRHGRSVTEEEVEAAIAASEGWPMGVALTSLTGSGEAPVGAVPHEELFHFLAEEVLDQLDSDMRLALVDSSVPATLTPEVAEGMGLAPDFLTEAERALFLRVHPSGVRSYHPLFRAFLLEHLAEQRTEAERASLHARVATSLSSSGQHAAAIGHWLEAGNFEQALRTLAAHGRELVRTSPGAVGDWLSRLPTRAP